MASAKMNVEVYRTFVNAKGVRKDGREPVRTLAIALDGLNAQVLFANVTEVFPRLDGRFTLFWKDTEGSYVSLSPDSDVSDVLAAVPPHGALRLFLQRCQQETPLNKLHPNVVCNGCDGKVEGARFKCLECPDFDLCSNCEAQGMHSHHIMVKGYKPVFFKKILPNMKDRFPGAYPNQQDDENSGSAPRPNPWQMRRFWQQQMQHGGQGDVSGEPHWKRQRRHPMDQGLDQVTAGPTGENGEPWAKPHHRGRGFPLGGPSWRGQGHPMWKGWRNQQASGRWMHKFHQATSSDDEEKPQKNILDAMRPQWIQSCRPIWKNVIMPKVKDQEFRPDLKDLAHTTFCDVMEQCWQKGINLMTASGQEMPNLKDTPEEQTKMAWIGKSWELWQQPGDEKEVEDQHKCPFKIWRQFMRQSWDELIQILGIQKESPMKEKSGPTAKSDPAQKQMQEACYPWAKRKGLWKKMGTTNPLTDMSSDDEQRMAWVHRCHHIWKEQVMAVQPKGQGHGLKVAMQNMKQPEFRAFLRQCYQAATEILKQTGRPMPNLKKCASPEQQEDHSWRHPRKLWIDRCWVLWQEAFQSHEQEAKMSGEKMDGQEQKPWKGGPFQKWRQVIAQSWSMLKEELGVKDQPSESAAAADPSDQPATSSMEVEKVEEKMEDLSLKNEDPKQPQPLRKDWIQSCRLIWRTQVMAALPDDQPRSPQLVMQAMKQGPFRKYMRQCWQAALQILKKADVNAPKLKAWKDMESSGDSEDPDSQEQQKPMPPRRKWIDACWALWQQDISAKKEAAEESNNHDGKVNLGRPWGIQKWRCFMRKSWSLMLTELGVEELPEPETCDAHQGRMWPWAHCRKRGRGGMGGPNRWHAMQQWHCGSHPGGWREASWRAQGQHGCGRPDGNTSADNPEMQPKMWMVMKQKNTQKPGCSHSRKMWGPYGRGRGAHEPKYPCPAMMYGGWHGPNAGRFCGDKESQD